MKKEKDKELDNLFKKGLGDPVDAGYREKDWNALEQMLDKSEKRRGIIFWLPILSSAAVFLILFGWWLLIPHGIRHQGQKPKPAIAMQQPGAKNIAGSNGTQHQLAANNSQVNGTVKPEKLNVNTNKGLTTALTAKPTLAVIHRAANAKPDAVLAANTGRYNVNVNPEKVIGQRPATPVLVAFNSDLTADGVNSQGISSFDIQAVNIAANPLALSPAKRAKVVTKSGFFSHPQYALTVIGAPEVNGVNSLSQTRSGTNVGVLFSAGAKKLTFSTGAMYSVKPYNTYITGYVHSEFGSLTSIDADCRVLDIPLNVDFQFYNKHQNKFSIGSGLSSYIMLHESYQFNYSNPAIYGPVNYTVPNTDKYIFAILNLQATYTRQVTSNVGLSIEPYMKLPLTGIGANQAKLQTAGIAIGLSWNLNSTSKP